METGNNVALTTINKEVTSEEIVFENGKYVKKVTTSLQDVEVPVIDVHDLYNDAGEIIGPHEIPRMEPYETVHHTFPEETFSRTHYGLVAQEVETALTNAGLTTTDFAGFIYEDKRDTYGLRYTEFIAPMIKAIQELSAKVTQLEADSHTHGNN